MKKTLFFVLLSIQQLFSSCILDDDIMLTVLTNERASERDIGYEYIISFNNNEDAKKIKKEKNLKNMFFNNRTLDCKDRNTCSKILEQVLAKGIKNLDVGAYQVNTIFHLNAFDDIKDIFNIDQSYNFACSYIMKKIDRLGYNWGAIAAYHSETPEYNLIYKNKLIKNYKKIISSN